MKEFWKTGVALLVLAGARSLHLLRRAQAGAEARGRAREGEAPHRRQGQGEGGRRSPVGRRDASQVVKEGAGWKSDRALRGARRHHGGRVDAHEPREAGGRRGRRRPGRATSPTTGSTAPRRTVVGRRSRARRTPLAVAFGAKSPDGSSVYAKQPGEPKVYLVAVVGRGLLRQEAVRPARPRPAARQARRRALSSRSRAPRAATRSRARDEGEWAFTKPLATRAGPLGRRRPARHGREPAHGVGRGRERERRRRRSPASASTSRRARSRSSRRTAPDAHARARRAAPDPEPAPADALAARPRPATKGAKATKPAPPKPTKYYARQAGSGLVAVVPAALADDLAKGMGELRAKRLLEVATYEAEGFEVTAAGVTKKLRQEHDQGQGRPREDAVEAHGARRQGPRHHQGGGRALQDRRRRGDGVRRRSPRRPPTTASTRPC